MLKQRQQSQPNYETIAGEAITLLISLVEGEIDLAEIKNFAEQLKSKSLQGSNTQSLIGMLNFVTSFWHSKPELVLSELNRHFHTEIFQKDSVMIES